MDYKAYKRIPNALKAHGMALGLSQKEVAEKLGFKDKTWISHWENGDALPNLISALKLSKLYHVSVNELFSDLYQTISPSKI